MHRLFPGGAFHPPFVFASPPFSPRRYLLQTWFLRLGGLVLRGFFGFGVFGSASRTSWILLLMMSVVEIRRASQLPPYASPGFSASYYPFVLFGHFLQTAGWQDVLLQLTAAPALPSRMPYASFATCLSLPLYKPILDLPATLYLFRSWIAISPLFGFLPFFLSPEKAVLFSAAFFRLLRFLVYDPGTISSFRRLF